MVFVATCVKYGRVYERLLVRESNKTVTLIILVKNFLFIRPTTAATKTKRYLTLLRVFISVPARHYVPCMIR